MTYGLTGRLVVAPALDGVTGEAGLMGRRARAPDPSDRFGRDGDASPAPSPATPSGPRTPWSAGCRSSYAAAPGHRPGRRRPP
ncbi:hypothetical protein ACIA6T_22495 [Streptomyces sp. NPDC051740]|uniref:hypothetical protein n=1 Tax=Streptomyces sp. NPDC051740 TaxID=3365673 RepID=UPI00378DE4AA